jgi:hypothetical protein
VVRVEDLVGDARTRRSEPSSIASEPGAPKGQGGTGWVEAKPIEPRPRKEVELVDRLVERFVGGPNDPVR